MAMVFISDPSRSLVSTTRIGEMRRGAIGEPRRFACGFFRRSAQRPTGCRGGRRAGGFGLTRDLLEIHGLGPAKECVGVGELDFEGNGTFPEPPGTRGGILEGLADPLRFRGWEPVPFPGLHIGRHCDRGK